MSKILFIVAHRPGRSPGQRFRFEQYIPYLEKNGFGCEISWLLTENDDRYFYRKGHYLRKFFILMKTLCIRFRDIRRADKYDVVFLYREAVMWGSAWFEKRLRKKARKVILDYDDAIWLKDVSAGNRELSWMKRPSKTKEIIRLCDLVITGNQYLADFALQYNSKVVVVPTTIDTVSFHRTAPRNETSCVCIGWTGSTTTLGHLDRALPFLKKLLDKYGNAISIRVIADRQWEQDIIPVEYVKWNSKTEVSDLLGIDIGIMPLPDDEWARGKCGFKGLQYMALEIPAVMSPVGVNTEIIDDGKNGMLAGTEEEWVEKLSFLIDNSAFRQQLGAAGRKTVEVQYAYDVWKERYLQLFLSLL